MGDSKMQGAKAIAALSLGGVVILGSAAEGSLIFPGDLTTGGTSSAGPGSTPTNEVVANAFDDNDQTKVLIFTNPTAAAPITITYDFAGTTANIVRSYSITSANDSPVRDPADFQLLGSNDNFATPGVVVDTRAGVIWPDGPDADTTADRFETQFFTVQTPGVVAFQQYRLNILESTDPANDRPQLAEIQLFSTVVPEPSALIGVMTLAPLGLLYRRRRSPAPK